MTSNLHRRLLRLEAARRDLERDIDSLIAELLTSPDGEETIVQILAEILQEQSENPSPERGKNDTRA
jgi:hypothetical protein